MSNPNWFGVSGNDGANNGSSKALRNLTYAGSIADTTTDDTIILADTGTTSSSSSGTVVMAVPRVLKGESKTLSTIKNTSVVLDVPLISISSALDGDVVIDGVLLDGVTEDNSQFGIKVADGSANIDSLAILNATFKSLNYGNIGIGTGASKGIPFLKVGECGFAGDYCAFGLIAGYFPRDGLRDYYCEVSNNAGEINYWGVSSPLLSIDGWASGTGLDGTTGITYGTLKNNNIVVKNSAAFPAVQAPVFAGANGGILEVTNNYFEIQDDPAAFTVEVTLVNASGKGGAYKNAQKCSNNIFKSYSATTSFADYSGGSYSFLYACEVVGNTVECAYSASLLPYAFRLPSDEKHPDSNKNKDNPKSKAIGNTITLFGTGIEYRQGVCYGRAKYNILNDCYGSSLLSSGSNGALFDTNLIYQSGQNAQRGDGILAARDGNSSFSTANTKFKNTTVIVKDASKIAAISTINTGSNATFENNKYYVPTDVDIETALLFRATGTSGAVANLTWAQWQALGYDAGSTLENKTIAQLEQIYTQKSIEITSAYLASSFVSSGSSGGGFPTFPMGTYLPRIV